MVSGEDSTERNEVVTALLQASPLLSTFDVCIERNDTDGNRSENNPDDLQTGHIILVIFSGLRSLTR